jgi:ATP-binding cassette, subfamily B, bacterial
LTTATARPSAEFRVDSAPAYDRRGPRRWVIAHVGRYPGLLGLFFVGSLVVSVLASAVPRLTGLAFDEVLEASPDPGRLTMVALAVLVAVLLRGVLDLAVTFAIETLAQRTERDAREELYLALLGKSQTFHERQRVGDVMARATNDVRQLNGMLNPGVSLITESLLGLVVPLVFIALLDPRLLAAPVGFVVTFGFALRLYLHQLNPVTAAQRRAFGELNAGLNEVISGIEVVKSSAQEPAERRRFVSNARRYRDLFVRQGLVQARYLPLLLIAVAFAAAFAHGLVLVAEDELTTGDLIAYMGLVGVLRFPAFISIFTFSLVQLGLAGARRILELMDAETELDENPGGHVAPLRGELEFQDVSFAYEGAQEGQNGLSNVSFRVRPGQTVAIVGTTGSGKSTLVKLVNRIYDVTSGRVLVDGIDVRDWNLASLRSQMSVIEQDVFLFARSVEENIGFGLGAHVDRDRVVAAARAAQAEDFIERLPDGYATIIGERGTTLSGGQRQRLAIARALLTDPRVLVLDDATSAVDSETEDAIQRAIHAVLEGRTTLLITHRLAQIRRADHVILLERGSVVDQGRHDELLERSAAYRRIFGRS